MSDPLSYLPVTVADAPRLAALEERIFEGDAWPAADFQTFLANPHVVGLIARDAQGQDVGYALCHHVHDEAELLSIGLVPTMRGRGQGRALLARLLADLAARGVRHLFLEVRRSNAAAIALYTAAGALPLGVRKGYYDPSPDHPQREDALTFRLPVGGASQD
jgi:ribosomal-protein-alanine N-acetyltransferase